MHVSEKLRNGTTCYEQIAYFISCLIHDLGQVSMQLNLTVYCTPVALRPSTGVICHNMPNSIWHDTVLT